MQDISLQCVFVGGAGESARSSGRISAAVSQTVCGGPGGVGREDERKVRDENASLQEYLPSSHKLKFLPKPFDIITFLEHIRRNLEFTYLATFSYVVTMNGDKSFQASNRKQKHKDLQRKYFQTTLQTPLPSIIGRPKWHPKTSILLHCKKILMV